MIRRPRTPLRAAMVAALCASTLGGCGSHNATTDQTQATAAADAVETGAAADNATAAAGSDGAAPAANLPIYPGAKFVPMPAGVKSPPVCGHKLTIAFYDVAADGKTVAAWYKEHVPGALAFDMSNSDDIDGSGDTDGGTTGTSVEIATADGSEAAVVNQMGFDPRLKAAAKTLGADKTDIGLETFEPPLGQDYLALMAQVTGGDAAAKAAAKTKIIAMCPGG
jgi:hypothetical protein